ncbi:MAG: four helix bundle protein [Patescibacteria group bacterium]|nr:four helix bundle protein [Patescibacteria group bacterium]MDD5490256.1 four helix bundle protein [Patescibacteria group bacterium]
MENYNEKLKIDIKKRAYIFSLEILRFLRGLDRKDWILEVMTKQLLRCATSIGANIIEAQAASSRKDFINFLTVALKSANETKYWLGLLRDGQKLDIDKLLKEVDELSKILAAIIMSAKGKR